MHWTDHALVTRDEVKERAVIQGDLGSSGRASTLGREPEIGQDPDQAIHCLVIAFQPVGEILPRQDSPPRRGLCGSMCPRRRFRPPSW